MRAETERVVEDIEKSLFGLPYTLPTRIDADDARAQQFIEQGHAPAALSILDRLGSGEHPHLPSLYAGAKLRIGGKLELEQAVTALTRYIALAGSDAQPSPAAAWWRKGNAQELMGKTAEAEASYEQSLRLNPDDEDVRQALENLKRAKSTGR